MKNQTQVVYEDAQELREENQKLNNIIRKYKRFIENFDEEVVEEQRDEDHVGERSIGVEENTEPPAQAHGIAAASGRNVTKSGAGIEAV